MQAFLIATLLDVTPTRLLLKLHVIVFLMIPLISLGFSLLRLSPLPVRGIWEDSCQ